MVCQMHGIKLFVGCLVAAVHGWLICALGGAVIYVVRGDARPMLLSPCNTFTP